MNILNSSHIYRAPELHFKTKLKIRDDNIHAVK